MNTVKIGDDFESKSYELIIEAIKNGDLGIAESTAKVFQKKGYYSKDREKNIVFYLTIEVWPKGAVRYSLLFIIECKSSKSKKVPVDDVEEFYGKIRQVAGVNVKGVMISDKGFQSGGFIFAKNKGMMLIEVLNNNSNIILHRKEAIKRSSHYELETQYINIIKNAFGKSSIRGLKILSRAQIEKITTLISKSFNGGKSPINVFELINYLIEVYGITIDLTTKLDKVDGLEIYGSYNKVKQLISINPIVVPTEKFPFVLGHELGHFFLHKDIAGDQIVYNDLEDSNYNFYTGKHELKNDRNWIEWQANQFAKSLFLPELLFKAYFIVFRKDKGIRNPMKIYLDNQQQNKKDYNVTVAYLASIFNISKTAVIYRIEELDLISYANEYVNYSRNVFGNVFGK